MDNFPTNVNLFNSLDIWNQKVNYFRVNSIRLGYSFPQRITRKLHMAGLRVHFEARNPLVIARTTTAISILRPTATSMRSRWHAPTRSD